MTKRGLTILVVAVIAVAFGAVVIASSLGSDDEPTVHTMPNGQTMTGESMEGMGGEATTHQMPNGEAMEGEGMSGMDMGH